MTLGAGLGPSAMLKTNSNGIIAQGQKSSAEESNTGKLTMADLTGILESLCYLYMFMFQYLHNLKKPQCHSKKTQ